VLLQHLKQYKLRRTKVDISDMTEQMSSHVVFGTLNAQQSPPGYLSGMDPRHPSLGMRILGLPEENASMEARHAEFCDMMSGTFPSSPGNYEVVRRLAGVAEGVEIQGKVALESNQEQLNAVSFSKGCYLGQELTARVHYTGVLRKRIMPLLLLDTRTEVPQSFALASSLQEGRAKKRFTAKELKQLPSRLPRLSILTVGNLVTITTGAVEPEGEAIDNAAKEELAMMQTKASELLETVERNCQMGAKIVDMKDGKTIGQIVSPPVKGTNVVLALMRLESTGLLAGGMWSKMNKVKIGEGEEGLRYLPYLPLWWPEIDPKTGKAKTEGEDEDETEARDEEEPRGIFGRLPRITIEEVPLTTDADESKRET
jgi:folate-binding protein YgfZ